MSADLRKGSSRHSSSYYIIDIWKTPKDDKNFTCFYITTTIFLSLDVIKVSKGAKIRK